MTIFPVAARVAPHARGSADRRLESGAYYAHRSGVTTALVAVSSPEEAIVIEFHAGHLQAVDR